MILKCNSCGNNCSVDAQLEDGQTLTCPYCNGTIIYRKPSRVSVSTASRASGLHPIKSRPQILRNPTSKPCMAKKPMANNSPQVPTTPPVKSSPLSGLPLIVLALCVLGGLAFYAFKSHQTEESNSPRTETARESQQDLERQKRDEAERLKREQRLAQEQAERARELAERKQREADRARALAEKRAKAEQERMARERLVALTSELRNAQLVFAVDIPKGDRPFSSGKSGTYYLVESRFLAGREIYEVTLSNGVLKTATLLTATGSSAVSTNEMATVIMKNKFLLMEKNGPVWLYGTGRSHNEVPVILGEDFNPASIELGGFSAVLSAVGIVPKQKYRVTIKEGKASEVLGVFDYGKIIEENKLLELCKKRIMVIRERKANLKPPRLKKFRPTVVFYDGDIIRKEFHITKVPREFKHLGTKHSGAIKTETLIQAENQWRRLAEQAREEERKLQETEAENAERVRKHEDRIRQIIGTTITGEEINQMAARMTLLVERSRSKTQVVPQKAQND